MITNKRVSIALFIIAIFVLSINGTTPTLAHVEVGGDCDNPTQTVTITAAPSGKDSDVTFDVSNIEVPMGTCVTFKFINKAPTQAHSFVIDSTTGFGGVHIHLMNSTAGPDGGNSDQTNVMTPSSATDLDFYCGVTGHKAAGMAGTLSVTDPNASSPGFTFQMAILSLVAGMLAISVIRKKSIKN